MLNTSKLTNLMFRQVDNVVYDLVSGATAIKTASGLTSFDAEKAELVTNPMDSFGFELPAFAILTPVEQIKEGDLIVQDGKAVGFVSIASQGDLEVVRVDGFTGSYSPTSIKLFGQASGVQVVKSLFNFQGAGTGTQDVFSNPLMLMALMGDSKKDMKSLLPLMLLSGGSNMNPLMLMALMGDKSPFA